MVCLRKLWRFRTKGTCWCLLVLFILLASTIHNSEDIARPQNRLKRSDICTKIDGKTDKQRLTGFLVRRDKHLLYYCDVPKCGSTFMKMFLQEAFSCEDCYMKKVNMSHERKLYNYTKQMIKNSTYSFTFVREPYSRLFAAFMNKLYCPNELWQKLGTDIVAVVRKNASALSKKFGHDVTFKELAQYIIFSVKQGRKLNIHLAPINSRCNPCEINFNFIGKLESMSRDLKLLVGDWNKQDIETDIDRTIGLEELELIDRRDIGPVHHMFYIFSEYPDFPRYQAFLRLWSSYQLRGLILKEIKMPFSKVIADSVDKVMYEIAVENAIETSMKNTAALKMQRTAAFVRAYRALPAKYLYGLKEVYKWDFALFNYEDDPSKLFASSF